MSRRIWMAVLLLAAAVQPIFAQTWVDYATVSMTNPTTPKLTANRVCYTDGTDMACDGAAGMLSTSGSLVISTVAAGGLTVTGATNAATVSASAVYVTGTTGVVSATYGYFTYISASNGMSGGGGSSSATTAVAFSVNKGGVNQSITNNTPTKLTWNTKAFDTNNNFASDKFTPTVAGKYLFVLKISCVGGNNISVNNAYIYKNGAVSAGPYYSSTASVYNGGATSAIIDMNGSTDYVETYAQCSDNDAVPVVNGGAAYSYFQGTLLGPGQITSGTTSSSSGDRIVSTSANVVAMAGGTISFTTGGTSGTAYLDTTGRLVAPGISATTNQTSVTSLYASRDVGIGVAPSTSYTLAISSTTGISNAVGIGTYGAGTARLEVGEYATNNHYAYIDLTGDSTYPDYGLRLIRYNTGANAANYLSARGTGGLFLTNLEAAPIAFLTSNSERMRIDASGNVGIGTAVPDSKFTLSANTVAPPTLPTGTFFNMMNADGGSTIMTLDAFGAGTSQINLRHMLGTAAAPSAITSGSSLGQMNFMGYGATGPLNSSAAKMTGVATEDWTDSTGAAALFFSTRASGNVGGAVERMRIDQNGNVGIGTSTATARLDVSGSIVARAFNAGSGTTIDFSQSNLVYSSAVCGAITLQNMQDGGTYTLVLTGSGTGPASFTHSGLTVKTNTTLSCTSGKHTVFTFLRAGSNVYVNISTGF